jgi:cyclic pyranopterin phosphate synthase
MEQIERLCGIIDRYEINSVKVTGGEPLLHPHVIEIVKRFASIPTLKDISLVTNGILLGKRASELKEAGLKWVNIGLDSLCNPSVKYLDKIEDSIKIVETVGFDVVKLNMVLLKGINDREINDMMKFAREHGFILQLIELIETNKEFFQKYHVDLTEIERKIAKQADNIVVRKYQDRKQYYLKDGTVVEIVRPVHNPQFCMNCHTLRVTSDFQFQPCLNRSDNLIPIGKDIEAVVAEIIERRIPYNVSEQCVNG